MEVDEELFGTVGVADIEIFQSKPKLKKERRAGGIGVDGSRSKRKKQKRCASDADEEELELTEDVN